MEIAEWETRKKVGRESPNMNNRNSIKNVRIIWNKSVKKEQRIDTMKWKKKIRFNLSSTSSSSGYRDSLPV